MLLGKSVLKICSKFTREHPCQSVILIKLFKQLENFTEITLRHWSSPVNLLHIFRTFISKNTSGRLLLKLLMHWRGGLFQPPPISLPKICCVYCIVCYYNVKREFQIESAFCSFTECQGTPFSKQTFIPEV